MASFRCYDNSDVIATLIMTNFHLNTSVVAIFPNVCLWRRSLCANLVLTKKTCLEPPPYASNASTALQYCNMALVSFRLFRNGQLVRFFLGKWFTPPLPAKNFPYAYDQSVNLSSILQEKNSR